MIGELHHIGQARIKKAKMLPNAPDIFSRDTRWLHYNSIERTSCLSFLTSFAAQPCLIVHVFRSQGALMYGAVFDFHARVIDGQGAPCIMNCCQFPADYFEVVDMGFVVAR